MATIDYKEKYEQALEKARQLCAYPTSKPFISDLQDLFPDLAESKDEKIRKELIRVFSNREKYVINQSFGDINVSDILAWLEKQGEKETLCDKCKKAQPSHSCQDITALGRCAVEHEQKPAEKITNSDIEYVRKDAFIEKAVNFMEMLGCGFTITDNITHTNYGKEQLIEDFRKYLEE